MRREMSVGPRVGGVQIAGVAWERLLRREALAILCVAWAAILVVLATYHLDAYPTPWFDEGSHLHVPKALVERGVYADVSSEGYRYFGPSTGVGPTVMLPVALVFKIAGIGLLQARVVAVLYLLAAVALFTEVVRRRYGLPTALLASVLIVAMPGVNLLYLGRQVLGEVPAFAFLMLGVLLWWKSMLPARGATARLIGAGLAFGLAALTKNQFTLLLVPAFLILAAADRFYYRRLRLRHFAVPLAMIIGAVGAAYALQLLLVLRGSDLSHTLALARQGTADAIFVFSPRRILSSLKFLSSADVFAFWGLPALLYGFVLARERSLAGLQQGFLLAFAVVGLTWYAFGSIGWPRYAFPPLAVAAIFVAKFFADLLRSLNRPAASGEATAPAARAMVPAVVLAVGLVLASAFQQDIRTIATGTDRSPQQVAAYLDANVPPSAVIETWEPELGFLSDHDFHYPPFEWLYRSVRAKWLESDRPLDGYDPEQHARPSYVVVGPFGKYSGIYASVLPKLGAQPIATIGQYDIYRVVSNR